MARADLLVSLVQASAEGDRGRVRKATEAIIAEKRAKNHHVLADRLIRAVANGAEGPRAVFVGRGSAWRRFATELVPRRRLEDLVLSDANRAAYQDLIEEQRRASVLRAHSLEPRHRVLLVGPPGNGVEAAVAATLKSWGERGRVVADGGCQHLGRTVDNRRIRRSVSPAGGWPQCASSRTLPAASAPSTPPQL